MGVVPSLELMPLVNREFFEHLRDTIKIAVLNQKFQFFDFLLIAKLNGLGQSHSLVSFLLKIVLKRFSQVVKILFVENEK